jgi:hypothetical protein
LPDQPAAKDRPEIDNPSDVEFYVIFPKEVSSRSPFTVYVRVVHYKPPGKSEVVIDGVPESLVARIQNQAFISVIMESDVLEIDNPLQSLIWRNRAVFASFVMHPTSTSRRITADNEVWIAVDGLVRGTITFSVTIDPRMNVTSNTDLSSIELELDDAPSTEGSRAQAVKNAFICYAHSDWHRVSYLAESLEAAGINVWIDALEMKRQPDWTRQAQGYIAEANLAYVCWSESARQSESVTKNELKWIEARFRSNPNDFDVVLAKLEDVPAPPWLEVVEGTSSKRWQFFRAGMREEFGRKTAKSNSV